MTSMAPAHCHIYWIQSLLPRPLIPALPVRAALNLLHTYPSSLTLLLGSYRLPMSFGVLKERVAEYIKALGPNCGNVNDFLFDKINYDTGAFIPHPRKLSEQWLHIWGSPTQVMAAKSALMRLLNRCSDNGLPKKKKAFFAKVSSYSQVKEARLDLIDKSSTVIELLRQRPSPAFEFLETLLFLWPTDEVPFDLLGPQLEALDSIRRETGCFIYVYDEQPSFIKVDGDDHDSIITAVHRLRAKWAEIMAKIHIQSKLYLVQAASSNVRSKEVAISRVAHSVGGLGQVYATPVLHEIPLTSMDPDTVQGREEGALTTNESRLRETVQESLQGLRFLRGHVRMRVNFGIFILDDYREPKNSKARYSFDEFRTMLLNSRTRGHLVQGLEYACGNTNLLAKCSSASHILAPIAGPDTAPLKQPEPFALLRLEVEFAKSPSTNNFEVYQKRWIRPQGDDNAGDIRPLLQVAVIDFERSDWQLEIKALEFQEPSTIEQSLREFSHSVHFNPEKMPDLSGPGKQRVSFSNLAPIARIVEKSALRYRLKGTNYIFELARYDEYSRAQLTASQLLLQGPGFNNMSPTPVTSWGASIFDLQWDNMLGQHANFGAGHNAKWSPSLNTFFPCFGDADPSDLRSGFNSLIPLIEQVSTLLGQNRENGSEDQVAEQQKEETEDKGCSDSPASSTHSFT
ncbi:hypothetical protein MGYG_04480 [Nannizzia gypsea CBS 118893]|uniref:DUF7905 domain-containing protein n=1 Tax=Arthroderma gypseum (strain ATCC MYA-4604 / CBS 118893) TaxID=535722 RepID=E4UT76_ARTGP|nr:hypothetical protein MGYG_04480 [Nannizzia gypsea CBS 118893]EFR01472.1 hypothetical protein MGYG_04480 [Nannizzia gypsea CBS 118893]